MKKIKGKRLCSLLCLALSLMLTAGCTSQNAGQDTSAQSSEDKPELTVWVFFDYNTPGTYYVDLWDELAEEFGYEVDLHTYSTEQIKYKLRYSLMSGELPDIFAVWGGKYPDFLFDAGACVPVEDYLASADITYKDSYVQPYEDGHNYIIPCLVEAYAVTYCNLDLMEEMGLTMPTTWDELIDFVKAVNRYNRQHGTDFAAINLGNKDSWLGELLYCMIVNRIDPYALDKLAAGTIDFSDPVFKEAADKLVELAELDAFPENFTEMGEVESVYNFAEGNSLLLPHQSTIVYYLLDEMGSDTISMEQFPSCNEEYDDTYEQYMMDINHTLTPGLCISSKTEYEEEAAKLCLEFAKRVNENNVTQYDYLDMTEGSGLTPAADSPLAVQRFHEMVEGAEKFTPLWYAVLDREDGDNWRNLTKKLLGGAITSEEFVESAAEYLNF